MLSICSLFRDSMKVGPVKTNQVDRFFTQCEKIKPDKYFLVEGDSTDNTWEVLGKYKKELKNVELFKCNVGGRVASTAEQSRFKALSKVGNIVLEPARDLPSDLILWVESDFIVPDGTFEKLIEFSKTDKWETCLGVCGVPTLGPLFYDTWAYTNANNEKYSNFDLEKFLKSEDRYVKMKAFGSMALLNGKLVKEIGGNFGESGCFPYLCQMGTDKGYDLWCDTTAVIHHPCERNIGGRYVG